MPPPPPARVLFVCLGNAYRSQMAEGLANRLGRDVLAAESAGLTPVVAIPETTLNVMREKGIDIAAQFPKSVEDLDVASSDLVINMAGMTVPRALPAKTRAWSVPDPVWAGEKMARDVRDEIETLVMSLILELRRQRSGEARPRQRPKMRGV